MKQTIDNPGPSTAVARIQRFAPAVLVAVFALYLLMGISRAAKSDGLYRFDFDSLGKVAVSEDGRVKPFDSVARNALLQVSGKQSLKDEMLLKTESADDKPAVIWLAELMAGRPESMQRKVIRIDDPGVLGLIGKTPEDGKYFSLGEFMLPPGEGAEPVYFEVGRLAQKADEKRDDQRTKFEDHVIGLSRQLALMGRLRAMTRPFVVPPLEEGQEWAPILDNPAEGTLTEAAMTRKPAETWLRMMTALRDDKPQAFNAALAEHLELKQASVPGPSKKAAFERGYNRYAPFVNAIVLYLFGALLGLLSLLLRPLLPAGWYTALWRSSFGILVLGFVLHTAALLVRIWLQGRPPVTNLYSSAVFIGWGVVGGAIVLEKFTKLGVAALAASSCGVATLIVAHNLAKDGDTMGVMQAVLDSNFWLGTHVITITLGYSATFLAGFIAILYILLGLCTPALDRKAGRAMAGMVYATICFALLFSFVGTVLGGIWADQSWGRFWGWDPKENGAILIVLMNAIILHARWGHLVRERGIMVLAVAGNVVTTWSWFGTNLLGVGLHSYGFLDGAWFWLSAFAASQVLIMSAALLVPTEQWWSFRKPAKKAADPGQAPVVSGKAAPRADA